MKIVNETEFDKTISSGVTMVDFFADWCGPCKMIAPVIEDLSGDYEGKVNFIKVNVDQEGALAQRYGVMSIPTLILFKDGEIVDQVLGFQPKPALQNFINKAV